MITKNGVCYNIKNSPFVKPIGHLNYYFSSASHLEKFTEKLQENRDFINGNLTKKYKVLAELNTLADYVLYKQIETRGHYITDDKGVEICQETLKCCGGRLTSKS